MTKDKYEQFLSANTVAANKNYRRTISISLHSNDRFLSHALQRTRRDLSHSISGVLHGGFVADVLG